MSTDFAEFTDADLFSLVKTGDVNAFSEVYQRYWPILYRHAFKMLRNSEESEDVVQDVLVKFWKIAPDLPQDTRIAAYLYTSTRNSILTIFSRNQLHEVYLGELSTFLIGGYEVTDHLVREKLLAKIIQDEIDKLPPRMREVFQLKRKANLSYREIADQMNISELTVKTQMTKAISVLRSRFGDNLSLFLSLL